MKRAALLALCLACGRTRLEAAKPHAIVDTRPVDFGQTPVLFPVQRDVLVSNGGRVTLHLTGIAVQGGGFELPQTSLELAAGDSAPLHAIFRPPQAGSFAGTLSLQTDDDQLPQATIALAGVGTLAGALSVTPPALDFGRVGEGQTATRQIALASQGPADLYLGALAASPEAFAFVGSVKAPATLAAGTQAQLAVRFSPGPDTPSAEGVLTIDSSDPSHPHFEVPLAGSINRAPIAVAQASSLDAPVGAVITLDAGGSSDPDGDLPLSFSWSLSAQPVGSSAAIASPQSAQTTLQLDQPGVYSVLLVATDSTGLPSVVPARLDIRAAPAEQLLVELVWDQIPPDLDLHFLQQGALLDSSGDCFWSNPAPGWGPVHEGDRLTGYGPETVKWAAPSPGTYSIEVVYAADHGAPKPATNAQVRIYVEGVIAADLTHAFKSAGEVWTAGTLSWPSGKVVSP